MTAAPPIPLSDLARSALNAPAHWRVVDFISDLHLQASQPDTFLAWQRYMVTTPADAVFILGDLFEVWVGDDATTVAPGEQPGFEASCLQVLHGASQRLHLYFIHGNRDFLLGQAAADAGGITLLADPTVLVFDSQRFLLTHGDALCLDDTQYQRFRLQVRSPAWQTHFLAQPLAARQALARGLRDQSESRKASGVTYADVDTAAALQWLDAAQAHTLIHGHTHKPADHLLSTTGQSPIQRLVLSDWDAAAKPPRLEVLRLRSGRAVERVKLVTS